MPVIKKQAGIAREKWQHHLFIITSLGYPMKPIMAVFTSHAISVCTIRLFSSFEALL